MKRLAFATGVVLAAVTAAEAARPAPADRCFRSAAVDAKIAEIAPKLTNPSLREMFVSCYPNTLDTTMKGDDYVITGDIDAMWLRDSAAQVWPYLRFVREDAKLKNLIAGLLRRQFTSIRLDPYANAFNRGPDGSRWSADKTDLLPELHERKWEVDSLCYPLRLAYGYWKASGDTSVFDLDWERTVAVILRTFREQQKRDGNLTEYNFKRTADSPVETLYGGHGLPVRPVGLIASGFRPSDDACVMPFLVPSNFFAADVLAKAAEILRVVNGNGVLAADCEKLASEVREALRKYAVVRHPDFGDVYAYEVDGYGGCLLMDDANAPSLLSLPYLCGLDRDDPVYANTRRFVLSDANPFFFRGVKAEGIGSPHTWFHRFWPMSVALQAMTSRDDDEIRRCLGTLISTTGGTGFMHEFVDVDDDTRFSRPWFAWANTLFGELIVDLVEKGRLDLVNSVAVPEPTPKAEDGMLFTDGRFPAPEDGAFARYELTCLKETGETLVVTGSVGSAGIRPLAEGLHALKPLAGKGETVRFLAIDPPAPYDAAAMAKALPRAAAKIRDGHKTVLFFAGDSVTATGDYGKMLALMLRRATGNRYIRAAKHAYPGCSADASVRNFARDTSADRPDALFVMYGLNDSACSIPTFVFAEELSWLAREAKTRFKADSVYLTPTPHFDVFVNEKGVPSNPPEYARRTIGFGEVVRKLGLRDGVTVVDAFDAIWSIGGGAPILETARKARTLYPPAYFLQFETMGEKTGDTIHPNALGHLRIARRTYETLMGRAKGPAPLADEAERAVDPPCWVDPAKRGAPQCWRADGSETLSLGLPAHATGSSGRVEDNRVAPTEGRSDWRVMARGADLVFTFTTTSENRKDGFVLFFDPRSEKELGTMGPYYWLECGLADGGAVSLRPGENSPAGAHATGSWKEEGGLVTAEIVVPARIFGAAAPAFPLGFSLVWRHAGADGKPTRLSWSERCHEWNTTGYGRIVGVR